MESLPLNRCYNSHYTLIMSSINQSELFNRYRNKQRQKHSVTLVSCRWTVTRTISRIRRQVLSVSTTTPQTGLPTHSFVEQRPLHGNAASKICEIIHEYIPFVGSSTSILTVSQQQRKKLVAHKIFAHSKGGHRIFPFFFVFLTTPRLTMKVCVQLEWWYTKLAKGKGISFSVSLTWKSFHTETMETSGFIFDIMNADIRCLKQYTPTAISNVVLCWQSLEKERN